jgi:hypothetical protein
MLASLQKGEDRDLFEAVDKWQCGDRVCSPADRFASV